MRPVAFGLPRGERTMFIELSFNQRPAEQKSELFRAIVANLRLLAGVPEEDVMLVAFETARENWWSPAGSPAPTPATTRA